MLLPGQLAIQRNAPGSLLRGKRELPQKFFGSGITRIRLDHNAVGNLFGFVRQNADIARIRVEPQAQAIAWWESFRISRPRVAAHFRRNELEDGKESRSETRAGTSPGRQFRAARFARAWVTAEPRAQRPSPQVDFASFSSVLLPGAAKPYRKMHAQHSVTEVRRNPVGAAQLRSAGERPY